MSVSKTLVYIDKYEEPSDTDLYIIRQEKDDILSYELECVGGLDILEAYDYQDLEAGYYYAEYTCETEHEYGDGYIAYSYGVLGELSLEPCPYWKGRTIDYIEARKSRAKNLLYVLSSLFKPHWGYDADSGGAGLSYTGYLPKTLYYYLTSKDLGWGKPVDKRFYLS